MDKKTLFRITFYPFMGMTIGMLTRLSIIWKVETLGLISNILSMVFLIMAFLAMMRLNKEFQDKMNAVNTTRSDIDKEFEHNTFLVINNGEDINSISVSSIDKKDMEHIDNMSHVYVFNYDADKEFINSLIEKEPELLILVLRCYRVIRTVFLDDELRNKFFTKYKN